MVPLTDRDGCYQCRWCDGHDLELNVVGLHVQAAVDQEKYAAATRVLLRYESDRRGGPAVFALSGRVKTMRILGRYLFSNRNMM